MSHLPDRISNVHIQQVGHYMFGTMVKQIAQKNLLRINKRAGIYFINLQTRGQVNYDGERNGTHWVVLLVGPGWYYYFDSFGFPPPVVILQRLKGFDATWNQDQLQPVGSDLCGFYCIMAIDELLNNGGSVNMKGEILKSNKQKLFTSDTKRNDKLVRRYKNSIYPFYVHQR
jgi:hypothetical protein